jgi:hypothetical protein
MKDVQATGEAFSPQKRTSSTSKHEISSLFFYICGPPGPDLDPDPSGQNQCGSGSKTLRIPVSDVNDSPPASQEDSPLIGSCSRSFSLARRRSRSDTRRSCFWSSYCTVRHTTSLACTIGYNDFNDLVMQTL